MQRGADERADATGGLGELRRLSDGELTPAPIARSERVLAEHGGRPLGSQLSFELDGKRYVVRQ